MIEGIIPNYTQIIFLKSHRFRKCSHVKFMYIIGYNNISLRSPTTGGHVEAPRGSHTKICGPWHPPIPQDWRLYSGGATPGLARANALAEIPPHWQSKVAIIVKLYIKIFWLPLLMRLKICLCPAMSSGLAPPLRLWLLAQTFMHEWF